MTSIYLDMQIFQSPKDKDTMLSELTGHFRGHSQDLKKGLEFWDKIASAKEYGLIEADIDYEALENLRELVKMVEYAEVIQRIHPERFTTPRR